jgi:hypothetical protein
MMAWLAIPAAAAMFIWHLVRPSFRSLRVSMAHLLPDPPASRAPRSRISPVPPMGSPAFWLRMALAGLVIAALMAHLLPPTATAPDTRRLRIVLDASPSMTVGDRFDQARAVVREVLSHGADAADLCIDLVIAGASGGPIRAERIEAALASLEPGGAGMPADRLIAALSGALPGGCGGAPTNAAIVTDLPPRPIPSAQFPGVALWRQVGAPAANVALTDVSVRGGGLGGARPSVIVRAQVFGAPVASPRIIFEDPEGARTVSLVADPARAGGWTVALPFRGPGRADRRRRLGGRRRARSLACRDRAHGGGMAARRPAASRLHAHGGR